MAEGSIIDCHCHAGHGDGLTGPWDTAAPLGDYLRRADRAGIRKTVLFSCFHSDYEAANLEVARIVERQPERFCGFVFVNGQADRSRMRRLVERFVHGHGFRGIKIHRYDTRISREVCRVAREFALPVLYDVMGEVSCVHLLAGEYADVDFVIPHLGSFGDDWAAQKAFLPSLARYPNIFTDTSGVRRFDLLVQAIREAGPHKVLFGSDGPWLHPGLELGKVRALGLQPAQEQLVLGGNLLRLLTRAKAAGGGAGEPSRLRARDTGSVRGDPWRSVTP